MRNNWIIVLGVWIICSPVMAGWVSEYVDGTMLGMDSSLALDHQGRAHISCLDPSHLNLAYIYQDDSGWQMEIVDHGDCNGYYTSIALDEHDQPHISYFDCAEYGLKYAYRDGSGWHVEMVDVNGYVGLFPSIAIDTKGRPHISYLEKLSRYQYGLSYAYRDPTGWTITKLNREESADAWTSIAVDSNDFPHIAYSGPSYTLYYAHQDQTGWHFEDLQIFSWQKSIALDSNDSPHICTRSLVYAFKTGDSWTIERFDEGYSGYGYPSIKIDSNDSPHICYRGNDEDDPDRVALKYLHQCDDGWEKLILESWYSTGSYASMDLDSHDYPHISYLNSYCHDFRFAYQDSSGWHYDSIDAEKPVGWYSSLAFDSSGRTHLSYLDYGSEDLKYAVKSGQIWYTETIDSIGSVGWYTSLDLDSGGYPHISYYDKTNGDLKYAFMDFSGWTIEVVDQAGDVGERTSLILDSGGVPHIAYRDTSNHLVKFAFKDHNGWNTEIVDTEGGDGSYGISIALNQEFNPSISYGCSTYPDNGKLKYAWRDGTKWHIEVVPENKGFICSVSHQIDANGFPHIAIESDNAYLLQYAIKDQSGWHLEIVDHEDGAGRSPSLVLDSDNMPHISYGAEGVYELRYAYRLSTGWEKETVLKGYSAENSCIRMNPNQEPIISYIGSRCMLFCASKIDPYLEIYMPTHYVSPGDNFYCIIEAHTTKGKTFSQVPLFVLIELGGNFYCLPSFSEFDYYTVDITTDFQKITVLAPFRWPENAGYASGVYWYAAIANQQGTEMISNLAFWSLNWGE